jgi:hypothetical protein
MRVSLLLNCHAENATLYTLPIEGEKSCTGILFIQIHETEPTAPPRHDIGGQIDGLNPAKFRK